VEAIPAYLSKREVDIVRVALAADATETGWRDDDHQVLKAVTTKLEALGANGWLVMATKAGEAAEQALEVEQRARENLVRKAEHSDAVHRWQSSGQVGPCPVPETTEEDEQFEPLEELRMHARPIAALFVDTFGCQIDPDAHAEWSAEKWRITSAYVSPAARALGHDIYQAELVAETRRLAAGLAVTDDQLRALGRWARSAGNDEVEELCTYALDGDLEARAQCAELIARENG